MTVATVEHCRYRRLTITVDHTARLVSVVDHTGAALATGPTTPRREHVGPADTAWIVGRRLVDQLLGIVDVDADE